MTNEEIRKNISLNLISIRKKNNLTQQKFAEIFSYSDKTVSKWEINESTPSVETLYKICEHFNVDIKSMITKNLDDVDPIYSKNIFMFTKWQKIIVYFFFIGFLVTISFLIYFLAKDFFNINFKYIFLWIIPISSYAGQYLQHKAFNNVILKIITETISVWSTLIALYYTLSNINITFTPMFFLGLPLQLIIIFSNILNIWKYKYTQDQKNKNNENILKTEQSATVQQK